MTGQENEFPDIELYHLYLSIPTGFTSNGDVIGYQDKSIGKILDDQDFFELINLESWLSKQFMDNIGWNQGEEITEDIIIKAFTQFKVLSIKPVGITYLAERK